MHHYERGDGKAPRQVIGATQRRGGGGYTVTLIGTGGQETHIVAAGSYPEALSAGIEAGTVSPVAVRLRRR